MSSLGSTDGIASVEAAAQLTPPPKDIPAIVKVATSAIATIFVKLEPCVYKSHLF
jgi:hypothetical protein